MILNAAKTKSMLIVGKRLGSRTPNPDLAVKSRSSHSWIRWQNNDGREFQQTKLDPLL